MTAAVLGAREGRPSVLGLQASLEQARDVNVNLALELRVQREEGLAFAERVRTGATRLYAAAIASRRDVVLNEAGRLGYEAERRIRQIGSVVL